MSLVPRLRDERGFTMVAVMIVMLLAGLFVAGAYAAADGDLPLGAESRDSKQAYAAAEAGVDYYAFQIARDNDFWNRCATPPTGSTGTYPIVPEWYGPGYGPDTRATHWRLIPGATSSYAVEVLAAKAPATGAPTPQCVTGDQDSVIDPSTGTFRIRSTGKSGNETRSIIASFRRPSFLDFLWFTNYENLDPAAYPTASDQAWATTNCTGYRPARNSSCSEITFPASDQILGPFHSNDSVLFSTGTTVGRTGKNDRIETAQPWKGYFGSPTLRSPWTAGQDNLPIPTSNGELKTVAQQPTTPTGRLFTGKTTLQINNDVVTATTYYPNASSPGTTTFNLSDTNGVIYVQSASATACTSVKSPQVADYAEPNGCGNVYVTGSYSKNLTVSADNDIIVGQPNAAGDLVRSSGSDALAGLVALNFVRVWHRVTRTAQQLTTSPDQNCTNISGARDVKIDAAMLSMKHSFIVDNFDCGAPLGTVHVRGAIAQNFRGRMAGQPTATGVDSGFLRDFQYDDRMKFRSPPYFLAPLVASWRVIRKNEQVPAR